MRRLSGHIGAEITGVDLSRPLGAQVVRQLRDAVLAHKVIFFRDQNLDHSSQIAFAHNVGELTHAHPHEDAPPEQSRKTSRSTPSDTSRSTARASSTNTRSGSTPTTYAGWHTDVTASVNPPWGSILRAETVPEFGGDTSWSNQVAAYQALSEPLKQFIDGLRAQHRFLAGYTAAEEDDKLTQRINANLLVPVHPVVRVHPETGEKTLYVNPGFTDHIVGLSKDESRRILELLTSTSASRASPYGSTENQAASRSGTTNPPPTSARKTSATSTWTASCTAPP